MLNIEGIENENLGGISRLFFTEQKNLLTDPIADQLLIRGEILLAPGTDWHYLTPTPYTTSFEEEEERTANGYLYSQELKGFRAKDSLQLARAWEAMKGKKLILMYVDGNGVSRLIGDREDFVLLSRKLDTGAAPSQRAGFNFSFKGSSTHPAYYFQGAVSAPENQTTPGTATGSVTIKDVFGKTLAVVPAGTTYTLPDLFLQIDDTYLEI